MKDFNELSIDWDKFNAYRNCFATSNQENQSSLSFNR